MSPKSYVITLSLAGAAAALGFLMFGSEDGESTPAKSTPARERVSLAAVPESSAQRTKEDSTGERSAASPQSRSASVPHSRAVPAAEPPLSLEARAARVEQEANHELRRLVTLLSLSDAQQDQVFQSLAKHSRHWSPDMQFAPAATASGKRSATAPGVYIPGGDTPAKTAPIEPAPIESITSPEPAEPADPLEEIMAILDPEQQSALLKDEMDRTAWWAEILPQILPPDDVPALDGTPSTGAGEVREYEGTDVLE